MQLDLPFLNPSSIDIWNWSVYCAGVEILPTGEVSSSSDLKKCTRQIQDLVLGDLNNAIGDKLLGSVDILKDSYTGRRLTESYQ